MEQRRSPTNLPPPPSDDPSLFAPLPPPNLSRRSTQPRPSHQKEGSAASFSASNASTPDISLAIPSAAARTPAVQPPRAVAGRPAAGLATSSSSPSPSSVVAAASSSTAPAEVRTPFHPLPSPPSAGLPSDSRPPSTTYSRRRHPATSAAPVLPSASALSSSSSSSTHVVGAASHRAVSPSIRASIVVPEFQSPGYTRRRNSASPFSKVFAVSHAEPTFQQQHHHQHQHQHQQVMLSTARRHPERRSPTAAASANISIPEILAIYGFHSDESYVSRRHSSRHRSAVSPSGTDRRHEGRVKIRLRDMSPSTLEMARLKMLVHEAHKEIPEHLSSYSSSAVAPEQDHGSPEEQAAAYHDRDRSRPRTTSAQRLRESAVRQKLQLETAKNQLDHEVVAAFRNATSMKGMYHAPLPAFYASASKTRKQDPSQGHVRAAGNRPSSATPRVGATATAAAAAAAATTTTTTSPLQWLDDLTDEELAVELERRRGLMLRRQQQPHQLPERPHQQQQQQQQQTVSAVDVGTSPPASLQRSEQSPCGSERSPRYIVVGDAPLLESDRSSSAVVAPLSCVDVDNDSPDGDSRRLEDETDDGEDEDSQHGESGSADESAEGGAEEDIEDGVLVGTGEAPHQSSEQQKAIIGKKIADRLRTLAASAPSEKMRPELPQTPVFKAFPPPSQQPLSPTTVPDEFVAAAAAVPPTAADGTLPPPMPPPIAPPPPPPPPLISSAPTRVAHSTHAQDSPVAGEVGEDVAAADRADSTASGQASPVSPQKERPVEQETAAPPAVSSSSPGLVSQQGEEGEEGKRGSTATPTRTDAALQQPTAGAAGRRESPRVKEQLGASDEDSALLDDNPALNAELSARERVRMRLEAKKKLRQSVAAVETPLESGPAVHPKLLEHQPEREQMQVASPEKDESSYRQDVRARIRARAAQRQSQSRSMFVVGSSDSGSISSASSASSTLTSTSASLSPRLSTGVASAPSPAHSPRLSAAAPSNISSSSSSSSSAGSNTSSYASSPSTGSSFSSRVRDSNPVQANTPPTTAATSTAIGSGGSGKIESGGATATSRPSAPSPPSFPRPSPPSSAAVASSSPAEKTVIEPSPPESASAGMSPASPAAAPGPMATLDSTSSGDVGGDGTATAALGKEETAVSVKEDEVPALAAAAVPLESSSDNMEFLYSGAMFRKLRRFGKPEPRYVCVERDGSGFSVRDPKDKKDKGSAYLWVDVEELSPSLLKTGKVPKGTASNCVWSIRVKTKLYELECDSPALRDVWLLSFARFANKQVVL